MKSLLVKDFLLLSKEYKILLSLFVLSLVLSIKLPTVLSFLVFWFVISVFSVNITLNDDFDNFDAFVLTMPIKKEKYVIEKYIFFGITVFTVFFISVLLTAIRFFILNNNSDSLVKFSNNFILILLLLFITVSYAVILLPVRLKFGIEKSRCILYSLLTLLIIAIIYYINKVEEIEVLKKITVSTVENRIIYPQFLLYLCILVCFLIILSLVLSILIIRKKEF